MRTDFVLSLDGEVLCVSDRKDELPPFQMELHGGSYTVVRVVVDELLLLEEVAEIAETFSTVLDLRSGQLEVGTRYDEGDEDDYKDDTDSHILKTPKGIYRMVVHTTFAGPAVPERVEKETLKKYFTRTHPGEDVPSWLSPEDVESEDFWVGIILHLQSDPDAKPAKERAKVTKTGKDIKKPAVCPPGLLSDKPLGWEGYVQTDLNYIHKIPKMVANLTPVAVDGGPVSVEVKDLVLAYWIAWICGETHPWLEVKCPDGFVPQWPGFKQGIKATKTPGNWQIDIEGMNARWSPFGHLRQVGELLSGLPDGSSIELSCALDGEGKRLRQRYAGPVKEGQWLINQTYPAMNAQALAGMLDLVRQGETGTVVRAQDEKEANAIEKAIKTKDFLLREKPPVRKGLIYQMSQKDSQLMPLLVARAFAARYPKTLPMMDRDDDLGDWDDLMDQVAQAGARFATGDLVFEGRFAKFTVSSIDEKVLQGEVAKEDAAWLLEQGFELLGDLNSTQTFQAVFRGYQLPGEPSYASMITNGFGSYSFDFYTKFPDGFSLTTSAAEEKPKFTLEKKWKAYLNKPAGSIAERWESHVGQLASLSEKHGEPAPAGDFAAFASELDDFFCRMNGIK